MARKRSEMRPISVQRKADITPLTISGMVIDNRRGGRFEFERLRYCGVPKIVEIKKNSKRFTLADRDDQIRQLYELTASNPKAAFKLVRSGATLYLRHLDELGYRGDIFAFETMSKAIKHFNYLALTGERPTDADTVRRFLAYFLRLMGRGDEARRFPTVKDPRSSGRLGAYSTDQIRSVAKLLRKGLTISIEHIERGTVPERHPCFDSKFFEEQAIKQGWSAVRRGTKLWGFALMMKQSTTRLAGGSKGQYNDRAFPNYATRIAFYTVCMLTGMNHSVLARIRYSDVAFKDINGGRYILSGIKDRAGYKETDNAIGFTKTTKNIIEQWLPASRKLYEQFGRVAEQSDLVFPWFGSDGETKDYSHATTTPWRINQALAPLLGFKVNSTRLRKTKSDLLMRVTEDIFLVSQAANNTMTVVAKSYSSGVEADHKNNLSATNDAMFNVAKGQAIAEAVESAKVAHSDILTDYDYKERLKRHEIPVTTLTPSGIRCKGPSPEKMLSELRKAENMGTNLPDGEATCTDFFACFDCESHALVASETEIWLMMSFHQQMLGVRELPARNSLPKERLFEIEAILSKVLIRMQQKAPEEHRKAKDRLDKGMFHPLYKTRASLKYVIGDNR